MIHKTKSIYVTVLEHYGLQTICLLADIPEEEFAFGSKRSGDVLAAVDILLRTVHDTDVPSPQWQQFVLKNVASISAFVHKVQFCDDANCAQTCNQGQEGRGTSRNF